MNLKGVGGLMKEGIHKGANLLKKKKSTFGSKREKRMGKVSKALDFMHKYDQD